MAEEKKEGGGDGIFWGIVVLIGLLLISVPIASEIIFKWIPATIDVVFEGNSEGLVSGGVRSGSSDQSNDTTSESPTVTLITHDVAGGGDISAPAYGESNASTAGQERRSNVSEFFGAWSTIVSVSIFMSLLLLMGIVYAYIRITQIRGVEESHFKDAASPIASGDTQRVNARWQKVVDHSLSENENDWRLAILEADIMLDELLDVQGYRGDTMGDKMKQVERSDFNTIDMAWEAHKARNQIAHQGSQFDLNLREVRRIIGLYEKVFKEFHFI